MLLRDVQPRQIFDRQVWSPSLPRTTFVCSCLDGEAMKSWHIVLLRIRTAFDLEMEVTAVPWSLHVTDFTGSMHE